MSYWQFRRKLKRRIRRQDNAVCFPTSMISDGSEFDAANDLAEKELRVQQIKVDTVDIDNVPHVRFQKPKRKTDE